jgi:AhpD family alkylhydroperoxidase
MARVSIPEGSGEEYMRVWALSPHIGMGMGALSDAVYGKGTLAVPLREAARIRMAHINQCHVCLDTRAIEMNGLTEEHYDAILQWRDRPDLYDPRQQMAIEFAEKFATDHLSMDDAFWDRVHAVFTDAEIVELCGTLGMLLGNGRAMAVLGLQSTCTLHV